MEKSNDQGLTYNSLCSGGSSCGRCSRRCRGGNNFGCWCEGGRRSFLASTFAIAFCIESVEMCQYLLTNLTILTIVS